MKQKITPHLWFDKEAKEAAGFYVAAFGGDSKVTSASTLHDTPSGDADAVSFELKGQRFMAISGGPLFKFNPSVSFFVNFDSARDENAKGELDALWTNLSEGGTELMPLAEYPFSRWYGWIQDKYGVSWQLILTNPEGDPRPDIVPSLLYVSDSGEAAEEATDLYLSVFKGAPSDGSGQTKRGQLARYPAGMEPNKEGAIMFTDFQLLGQWFAAMDASASQHDFVFNEAISFVIECDTQEEIDYYWGALSAVPEAEQCGWLKDKYGVSWQVVPAILDELMGSDDEAKVAHVTQAFLKMKKFDIAALKQAYEQG